MSAPIKIFSDGVLAGAYRGRDLSARNLLMHAVADQSFAAGRLRREFGQAFCNPALDMAGALGDPHGITCPRCQEIVRRLMQTGTA